MTGFITPAPHGSGNAESAFSRLIGRGNSGRGNAPKTASPARMTACNPTPSSGESLSEDWWRERGPSVRRYSSYAVAVGRASRAAREHPSRSERSEREYGVSWSAARVPVQRAERGSSPAPQRARTWSGTAASAASEEPAERVRSPPSEASETTRPTGPARARPTPPRTGTCLLRPFAGSAALLLASRRVETVKSGVAR